MQHQVNYIFHLEGVFKKFDEDENMSPWHISLYLAIFRLWNNAKFKNPISVSRSELMKMSKTGSVNTYYKCIKDLHALGYLKYTPSKSKYVGSKISVFHYDEKGENLGITSCIESDSTGDTTADSTGEKVVRPYLNNIKHNKHIKHLYREDDKKKRSKKFIKPSLDEVKNYFLEKGSESTNAERFFNHFESNGWLVSGKSPMKDWKAAARNWMLNGQRFNKTEKANHLQTENEKNYDIPL
ncbi:hypothetical protein SAMN05216474_0780 [Lishizhenia tianjinensis]|uniref:Uncharacterized protein n=1 Tax=Lishizhenia tianjinensis TaxID=477690 RepID=A0A1I6YBU1_9FLAO|nr:hypothetical protein [Lishizhenia tianjinensis]SFT47781.1 hypothetical protein SAMN05216474_0780 [Lishizhenia tianjinensis]